LGNELRIRINTPHSLVSRSRSVCLSVCLTVDFVLHVHVKEMGENEILAYVEMPCNIYIHIQFPKTSHQ